MNAKIRVCLKVTEFYGEIEDVFDSVNGDSPVLSVSDLGNSMYEIRSTPASLYFVLKGLAESVPAYAYSIQFC